MQRWTRAVLPSFRQVLSLSFQTIAVGVLMVAGVPAASAQSVTFTTKNFIVPSSSSGTASDYGGSIGRVVSDKYGNIFFVNSSNTYPTPAGGTDLIEVAAGTNTQTVIAQNLNPYESSVTLDSTNNLWVLDGQQNVLFIPLVSGSYGTGTDVSSYTVAANSCPLPVTTSTVPCLFPNLPPNSLSAATFSDYMLVNDIQVDASGNLYVVDWNDGTNGSGGTAKRNRLVEFDATTGQPTLLVDNLPNTPSGGGRLVVRSNGDLYYVDGTSLYYSAYSAAGTRTFTTIAGYNGPTGVSQDVGGNLYVTDNGDGRLVFVPNVSGTLNFAGAYAIYTSSSDVATNPVGIDAYGNVYFAGGGYGGDVYKLDVGAFDFGTPNVGASSGTTTITLNFNVASVFGSFVVKGGASAVPYSTSGSSCTVGTTYTPGQTCTIGVTYNANLAGPQAGVLQVLSQSGTLLGQARLSGYGYGGLLNVDNGTVSEIGADLNWVAPTAIAVDSQGNTFVADSSTGKVYKNGNTTVVASGFSGPTAVAVDAAGNLYVADTGNNRIQEVPYINGAYGAAVTLYTGLSGPSGLAVDAAGNLYVADSGNSRVLLLASAGALQPGSEPTVFTTAFTTPVAVATTGANAVIIGDNGTKSVVAINTLTGAQTNVASGFTNIASIGADPGGSVYVVDSGAQKIKSTLFGYGSYHAGSTIETVLAQPSGIAVDYLGNLYVVDQADARVAELNRSQGIATFGTQAIGTNSGYEIYFGFVEDGPATVTMGTPYYTQTGDTADFAIGTDGNCANGTIDYTSYGCFLGISFTPLASGDFTSTFTFPQASGGDGNVVTIKVMGTGTAAQTLGSITVSGFPSPTSIGTTGVVTVTAVDTNGEVMTGFTGTVTFTSSDPAATLPAAYTFQASDNGTAQFVVTFNTGGTQSITATSGGISGSQTGIVVSDYIWIVNATGTTSQLGDSGSLVASGGVGSGASTYGGIAFDASGTVWSVTSGSNSLVSTTKAGASPTSYSGGGLSTPVSVAVDGAGSLWIANSGGNSVSEFLNSGTAQSGTSGYGSSGATALAAPSSVVVDGAGGLWVTNKTGNSVTHIFGAATPVVTPLSTAVSNGTVGVEP
jgi:hypothetical protein